MDRMQLEQLKKAIICGDENTMKKLLCSGFNSNPLITSGGLLQQAVYCGQCEIAKLLIEKNVCDINGLDKSGGTSLHVALRQCRPNMAMLLMDLGVKVDIVDKDGWLPIHYAAKLNLLLCAKRILEIDPDCVNATDRYNRTPLHEALATGSVKLVALLLRNGADPNIQPTINGSSTMIMILKQRHINAEIIDNLLSAGYNIHRDKTLLAIGLKSVLSAAVDNDLCRDMLSHATVSVTRLTCACRYVIRQRLYACSQSQTLDSLVAQLPLPRPLLDYMALTVELS